MSGGKTPTLLIVMGTSGSGKSTVGTALSAALHCPFVDGDDLHPASNVSKMSQGHPLNDTDREPWLIKIRQTGLRLATTQTQPPSQQGETVKNLAEIYETSHAQTTPLDHSAATISSSSSSTTTTTTTTTETHPEPHHPPTGKLAIIACSSLKLTYRRLLRGTIPSLTHPTALQPESSSPPPQDLKVIHIYLDLTRELLEERMSNRKGHFMKLDMLYSQLDTLQVPDAEREPGVIVVEVRRGMSTEQIVRDVVGQLEKVGVL
ncbi:related to thermoresistant gluconokinase [Sporisorium scitamineum]|uniref:gluconokinase n=1 Tax=Sporisorium scitamineum TaxID=49012 RepID=A0A127ZHI1_9BASI|nr:related to thermoresistant gluconokinase [Sporisorium scitamineum]